LCVCKEFLNRFYKDALPVRRWTSDICWIISEVQQDAATQYYQFWFVALLFVYSMKYSRLHISYSIGQEVDFDWWIRNNVKRYEYVLGLFKIAIKHLAGDTEKNPEHLSQNSRKSGPGSISGPSEYKAEGLSAQPWSTVLFVLPRTSCYI
jgi:hypothetical protein